MKSKRLLPYIATALIAAFITFAAIATILRPKPLNIGTVDLTTVSDGEYIGVCQNKLLFAVVKVEVQSHKIKNIKVLWHKASYMKKAQQIADNVTSAQSLNVDAVTGATLTSDTVLKAIENALNSK